MDGVDVNDYNMKKYIVWDFWDRLYSFFLFVGKSNQLKYISKSYTTTTEIRSILFIPNGKYKVH